MARSSQEDKLSKYDDYKESTDTDNIMEQEYTEEPKKKQKKKMKPKKIKSSIPLNERIGDFFKSKIVLGVICIVIPLIIVMVVSPLVSGLAAKRVPVVKMAENVERGTLITENMITLSEIGESDRPQNAAVESSQVIGTFAGIDLLQGDIVTSSKLTSQRPLKNPYLYELPQGKIAVSVEVKNLAEGLTGKLKAGDIVSVYAVFNNSNPEENVQAVSFPELKYVKVLASSNSSGYDIDVDDPVIEEDGTIENLPATITLEVEDYQALTLTGLNSNATVHVGLVARAANEELCKILLDTQSKAIIDILEKIAEEKGETATDNELSEVFSSELPIQNPEEGEQIETSQSSEEGSQEISEVSQNG